MRSTAIRSSFAVVVVSVIFFSRPIWDVSGVTVSLRGISRHNPVRSSRLRNYVGCDLILLVRKSESLPQACISHIVVPKPSDDAVAKARPYALRLCEIGEVFGAK